MKLIDIEDEVLWKNLSEGRRSAKQVVKLFMKQPIIEAIPISWLKSEMEKCNNLIGKAIYQQIIEDWRKENEE